MKENVQRFGRFLSGMVMPNIAVFIAWGFITALFIPTGWMPNETLAQMVAPMQRFLLPTLIAYTGGKMVYDVRGGVVGGAAGPGICAGWGGTCRCHRYSGGNRGSDVYRCHDCRSIGRLAHEEGGWFVCGENTGRL